MSIPIEFKVGDIVICKDSQSRNNVLGSPLKQGLVQDKEYTVDEIYICPKCDVESLGINIELVDMISWCSCNKRVQRSTPLFFSDRFILK